MWELDHDGDVLLDHSSQESGIAAGRSVVGSSRCRGARSIQKAVKETVRVALANVARDTWDLLRPQLIRRGNRYERRPSEGPFGSSSEWIRQGRHVHTFDLVPRRSSICQMKLQQVKSCFRPRASAVDVVLVCSEIRNRTHLSRGFTWLNCTPQGSILDKILVCDCFPVMTFH